MRILVLDIELMALDFCLRCIAADHQVRWYRHMPKKQERVGEGFKGLTLVDDWRASMDWAKEGLVVLTGNFTLTHELNRYRDFGFPIFAPTPSSSRLEIDRMVGIEAARAAGINVPEYHEFGGLDEAEAFVRKSDQAFVFKPGGDEENKALTYVADDPAELCGWLRRQIAAGKKMKKCLLQEKIDMLIEIGVSGWCGPEGFLPDKWQVCFEHKKLMVGERGPATGEMGTLCCYEEEEKLAAETLMPMEGILRTLGHRGDFAFGGAIDTNGKPWFFEWTARFGYPAWWIQVAAHRGDPANWMKNLLEGKDSLRVSYDAAIGVVCAQPRFPYNASPPELVEGNPIFGVEDFSDQIHLASVMQGRGPRMEGGKIVEGPQLQTTGEYVLVCTGLGKTIERARQKVYRAVEAVKFPDKIYREDIGCKVAPVLDQLHGHGYALGVEA